VDEEYKKICEKLGFNPSEYELPNFDGEDDSWINPFSVLTEAESDYLYDNGYIG
jgi:hypothetical protein